MSNSSGEAPSNETGAPQLGADQTRSGQNAESEVGQVPSDSHSAARTPAARPPLTDSPWFWAYLFGAAALLALFLAGPRYRDRQPQLERQYKARQHGGQAVSGVNGPIPPSTSERMIITLRPLYLVVGVLLMLAWTGLWYQRWRYRRPPDSV